MGLLKLFGINKVENILENECYNILDTWMNVETSVNKGLTKPKEAAGVLNAVCNDARAKLEQAKLKDLEAYNKYVERFDKCFKSIQKYIDSLSSNLKI